MDEILLLYTSLLFSATRIQSFAQAWMGNGVGVSFIFDLADSHASLHKRKSFLIFIFSLSRAVSTFRLSPSQFERS